VKTAITGATGLIGRALVQKLSSSGHSITVLARNATKAQSQFPDAAVVPWESTHSPPPEGSFEDIETVIHLAGESIAGKRWSASRKEVIRESRVLGTRHIVSAIRECKHPPRTLISGSAVGFYGNRVDEELDEKSPAGSGFLSKVCREWEEEVESVSKVGTRVVLLRTGIVLSTEDGALAKMLPPFRFFVGGPLGNGTQWMSWIHLQDEVGLILHAIENADVSGPINATAPEPVTNTDFSKLLGKVLGRPAFLPAPAFALRLLLGEMADVLLLQGQRVFPRKALDSGYEFKFPTLESALKDLLV